MDSATENLAFAFVDVLGTKALLKRLTLVELAEVLIGPLVSARRRNDTHVSLSRESVGDEDFEAIMARYTLVESRDLRVVLIADSALIRARPTGTSHRELLEAVEEVVNYVIAMAIRCSLEGVYIRGTVTCGEFIVRSRGDDVLMGMPMLEAMEWENYQDWSGVMLGPSALEVFWSRETAKSVRNFYNCDLDEYYRDLDTQLMLYDVPLKASAPLLRHPALVLDLAHAGSSKVSMLEAHYVPPTLDEALDSGAIAKVRNTLDFYTESSARLARRRTR